MKPVQIVLLVVAGALGGAILTRTWNKPKPTPAVMAEVQQPAAAPAAVEPASAPATQPDAVPAEPEPPKPSPAPRVTTKPKRVSRPAPPPANPRPVETARVEPPPPAPVTRPEPAPAPVESAPPVRPDPEPVARVAPPPPPAPHKVTLNAGALLPVRLVDGLSSERNAPGDTFTGTLDRELVVGGFVVAERGARVDGRVASVDAGGKVRGVASMAIHLTRIRTADGQTIPVQTDTFERHAEASHTTDAAKVGGGAALGAIIGAIAGGGKGAAIGAIVGAGGGAGSVYVQGRDDLELMRGTELTIRTTGPR